MKFEVGDKVRFVEDFCVDENDRITISEIIEIREGKDFPYQVKYLNGRSAGLLGGFAESELERV